MSNLERFNLWACIAYVSWSAKAWPALITAFGYAILWGLITFINWMLPEEPPP